jgi:DNA-binding NarL/FixJ family response regulator
MAPRLESIRGPTRSDDVVLLATPDLHGAMPCHETTFPSLLRPGSMYRLHVVAPLNHRELLDALHAKAPAVLLIDAPWCSTIDPLALRELLGAHRATQWLLGWEEPLPRWIDTAIRTGARGAVQWGTNGKGLVRALDAVMAGEMWFSRRVMSWLCFVMFAARRETPSSSGLTAREAEILALVREGLTNKQIAQRLGLSPATVRNHLAGAFLRLGLTSRRQLH